MRRVVKKALKDGTIRKESVHECADDLCENRKIRHTFLFAIGNGEYGNVHYCEECTAKMLSKENLQ